MNNTNQISSNGGVCVGTIPHPTKDIYLYQLPSGDIVQRGKLQDNVRPPMFATNCGVVMRIQ